MPNLQQISTYSLQSQRIFVGPVQSLLVRSATLSVQPELLGVSKITILYSGGNTLGRLMAPTLYVYFPESSFVLHSEIFRTEQPLFVAWDVNAQNQLFLIQFSTGEEPPGEGFVDQSA
jgi:hypothetical protein